MANVRMLYTKPVSNTYTYTRKQLSTEKPQKLRAKEMLFIKKTCRYKLFFQADNCC